MGEYEDSSPIEYRQALEGKSVALPERTKRYLICKIMHWDWWIYYEQPPEFLADIMEHSQVESEVAKSKTPGSNGRSIHGSSSIGDPDPDSILNYKEKAE